MIAVIQRAAEAGVQVLKYETDIVVIDRYRIDDDVAKLIFAWTDKATDGDVLVLNNNTILVYNPTIQRIATRTTRTTEILPNNDPVMK